MMLWWQKNLNDGYSWSEFATWLTTSDKSSRKFLFRFIKDKPEIIKSVLEIGPGIFFDYDVFFSKFPQIDYYSIDITPQVVNFGINKGIKSNLGSIDNILYSNYKFDLVYCRHVFEHIPYYIEALNQMIRVSDKYVVCIFFLLDTDSESDTISVEEKTGLHHNIYSKKKISKFLDTLDFKYEWHKTANDYILIIDKHYDITY